MWRKRLCVWFLFVFCVTNKYHLVFIHMGNLHKSSMCSIWYIVIHIIICSHILDVSLKISTMKFMSYNFCFLHCSKKIHETAVFWLHSMIRDKQWFRVKCIYSTISNSSKITYLHLFLLWLSQIIKLLYKEFDKLNTKCFSNIQHWGGSTEC